METGQHEPSVRGFRFRRSHSSTSVGGVPMSGHDVRRINGAHVVMRRSDGPGAVRKTGTIRWTVRGLLALASLAGYHGLADAQEVAAAGAKTDTLEEVVVTGSRIKRADYESQSPLVTVNADAFENKSS